MEDDSVIWARCSLDDLSVRMLGSVSYRAEQRGVLWIRVRVKRRRERSVIGDEDGESGEQDRSRIGIWLLVLVLSVWTDCT